MVNYPYCAKDGDCLTILELKKIVNSIPDACNHREVWVGTRDSLSNPVREVSRLNAGDDYDLIFLPQEDR